ncbi:GGDEF domain-containing protein [Sphingobium sp. Ant17]|uniref:GGDEF domain-containing protein n=1 Tax=Sphingobium sp. Ant17 TaxID=1461752 RepID=UPI001F47843E|nr:GGDEF domain-containing protein [Sphingobium sp. Ant17]
MTNVLNRRGLDEAAVRAIGHANRNQRPLALVICDLDGFKALNDGHGHIAGDEALRGFARLLTSAVRRGDIVARMGGDEFGLLLIDTDAAAAADVMERVRVEISCLIVPNAQEAALQASFGVAELIASDATLEDMVARADTALYQAKKDGKNRVAIWRAASPSAEGWFVEGTQLAAV